MPKLKIEVENNHLGEPRVVKFVAEDGRTMFDIRAESETSIEVGCPCICKVEGQVYDNTPHVAPQARNRISVYVPKYDQ